VLLVLFGFAVTILVSSAWMFLELGRKPVEKRGNSDPVAIAEAREQRERERAELALQREKARRERLLQLVPVATVPWRISTELQPVNSRRLEARQPWSMDVRPIVDATLLRVARVPWSGPVRETPTPAATQPWGRVEITPAATSAADVPFVDESVVRLREAALRGADVPWRGAMVMTEARGASLPWPVAAAAREVALQTGVVPWQAQRRDVSAGVIGEARQPWPVGVGVRSTTAATGVLAWQRPLTEVDARLVGEANLPWVEPRRAASPKLGVATLPWLTDTPRAAAHGVRAHEAMVPWADADGTLMKKSRTKDGG